MPKQTSETRQPPAVVFVDADNTLWDTDGVFAEAQLQILKSVQDAMGIGDNNSNELQYVREIDQELAERHHAGLRYPPRLLIQALTQSLCGVDHSQAVKRSLSGHVKIELPSDELVRIETQYFIDLKRIPKLLEGVQSGLMQLKAADVLVLVLTEGARGRVEATARAHALSIYIDRIIEAPKTPRLYNRVVKLTGAPSKAFMIGDQLKSDIQPANEAGLFTIHVPGRFVPKWELIEKALPSFVAENFSDAVIHVLECANISQKRVAW